MMNEQRYEITTDQWGSGPFEPMTFQEIRDMVADLRGLGLDWERADVMRFGDDMLMNELGEIVAEAVGG